MASCRGQQVLESREMRPEKTADGLRPGCHWKVLLPILGEKAVAVALP